jgi:hypothetical protein
LQIGAEVSRISSRGGSFSRVIKEGLASDLEWSTLEEMIPWMGIWGKQIWEGNLMVNHRFRSQWMLRVIQLRWLMLI